MRRHVSRPERKEGEGPGQKENEGTHPEGRLDCEQCSGVAVLRSGSAPEWQCSRVAVSKGVSEGRGEGF